VIIHGTALSAAQLRDVKDAGAKLVWSPQSNLRLYGETTRAADALTSGIAMGLGADWLPSGSPSLLEELKVARRVLRQQGAPVDAKRLVAMVTSEAAKIAALGDKLGRLRAGVPADLLVLERHHADPWESVLRADRRSVELVTIGGDIAYGRVGWVETLASGAPEPVTAWGERMALDLSYSVTASAAPPPRLADLRATLLARYNPSAPSSPDPLMASDHHPPRRDQRSRPRVLIGGNDPCTPTGSSRPCPGGVQRSQLSAYTGEADILAPGGVDGRCGSRHGLRVRASSGGQGGGWSG
jgi:hypothetical protein